MNLHKLRGRLLVSLPLGAAVFVGLSAYADFSLDPELAQFLGAVGGFMFIGFLSGGARILWRPAPFLASALIVVAWVIGMIAIGAWTASCPDCSINEDDNRTLVLWLWLVFYGPIGLIILAAVWLGATLTWLFRQIARRPHLGPR